MRRSLSSGILRGALAGAAGTTALNAATYLDMVVRGRPASDTPQQTVRVLSAKSGVGVPGDHDTRENRVAGLGPLLGILTGVSVGAAYGAALSRLAGRSPVVVGTVLVGAAAMAGSDVPMTALGLTDPTSWTAADWASDAVPHLAYGLVTALAFRAAAGPG